MFPMRPLACCCFRFRYPSRPPIETIPRHRSSHSFSLRPYFLFRPERVNESPMADSVGRLPRAINRCPLRGSRRHVPVVSLALLPPLFLLCTRDCVHHRRAAVVLAMTLIYPGDSAFGLANCFRLMPAASPSEHRLQEYRRLPRRLRRPPRLLLASPLHRYLPRRQHFHVRRRFRLKAAPPVLLKTPSPTTCNGRRFCLSMQIFHQTPAPPSLAPRFLQNQDHPRPRHRQVLDFHESAESFTHADREGEQFAKPCIRYLAMRSPPPRLSGIHTTAQTT